MVVGGGVIGAACAYRLQEAGIPTTVLDEESEIPSASWGNAGHIATEQISPMASPDIIRTIPQRMFAAGGPLDFCWQDIAIWMPWAVRFLRACTPTRHARGRSALTAMLEHALPAWRRLAAASGKPDLLMEHGHFVLWETPSSAARGRAAWTRLDAARIGDIDRGQLAGLCDRLAIPIEDGVAFKGTGQVCDPALAMDAIKQAHRRAGGDWRRCTVNALVRRGDAAALVLDDGGRIGADLIVIAAGVGSRALMAGIGVYAPVIAERGYHVEGAVADDWPAGLPPLVFEDRSLIATRFGSRLRVSSFVEFGRRDTPPDPRKWARIEHHIRKIGLPIKKPFSRWMGARPTLPDYLPAIGIHPDMNNLLYAFGHQHLGLTLAALTAEIVTDLACRRAPAVDLTPFDVGRFAARSA
ncbi:MAG: FAD-binding oxidoreductase [Alphaproteobacteria bacterium]|nr:FAD-binding oxidoreductase [Alphaproteobacteria bacterium]